MINDIRSSRVEYYGDVARVFNLYSTLLNDPKLEEFRFITSWNKLSDEEKLEKYSPRQALLIELHCFARLTLKEVAEHLEISLSTAESEWRHARAWLRKELRDASSGT